MVFILTKLFLRKQYIFDEIIFEEYRTLDKFKNCVKIKQEKMKGKILIIFFLIGISLSFSLNEPLTPTGKYNLLSPDTIEFNQIMDLWNSHQYNKAKIKLEKFIEKYPASVWKAEAKFHLGCLFYYDKNYEKAEEIFIQLKNEYKNSPIENKVNIRLSNLYYKQNRIDESIEKLKEVLANNPTPFQYKYSFAWLRHLKTQKIAQKKKNAKRDRTKRRWIWSHQT